MPNGVVLHVEDDAQFRRFVGSVLEQSGFALEAVETGIEALKRMRERTYDLVILDLVLPTVNGIEVFFSMRARAETRDTPILVTTGTFVTANLFARDRHVSVLQKPFDDRQLVAAVETLLYAGPPAPA